MNETLELVLGLLPDAKKSGKGWKARCPAHDDKNPSLSIREGDDGRTLLTCHAGCDTENIVSALGLKMRDLFPERLRNGHAKTAQYEVRDAGGELIAVHYRKDLPNGSKRVWWSMPDGPTSLGGMATADLPLYGSERVKRWPSDVPIIVTEGEKAADALRATHVPALGTVTGASGTPGDEALAVLEGRHVFLWADADDAGRGHMGRVAKRLGGVAKSVRVFEWRDAPKKGADAADHPAVLSGSRGGIEALYEQMNATPEFHASPTAVPVPPLKGEDSRDTRKRPPLRSLRFNEIPDPGERRYLIEGLVPEGYPTLLHGDGGVAKSMLAMSLGLAVAGGSGDWLGHKVGNGSPVLYLDFELDAPEQRRRVLRMACGMGLDDAPNGFRYMSTLGYGAEESFAAALRECEEHGVKLLILDSLGPALQGDAAAAKDVIGFVQRVMEPFRAAGVTVLIVDHQSRVVSGQEYQNKDAFGSVYKRNLTRSVIQVEPIAHHDGALTVRFRHKKHNFGPLAKPSAADLTFTHDSVTVRPRELGNADLATENTLNATDRVRFALQDGPMFPNEIAETTGQPIKTVKNALTKLREAGAVMPTGQKNNVGAKQVSLVSPPLRDGTATPAAGRPSSDIAGLFGNPDAPALAGSPA